MAETAQGGGIWLWGGGGAGNEPAPGDHVILKVPAEAAALRLPFEGRVARLAAEPGVRLPR